MEYCVFSFTPFKRVEKFNSLDQCLQYLSTEDLFTYFPGILNFMESDIGKGLAYLHDNKMVHRDIKPGNILVTNTHYAHETKYLASLFEKRPVICKLADFGEGQSEMAQTKTSLSNKTKLAERAFMAPEISVGPLKLTSVGNEQLKSIDNWALIMTIFVILNPDQEHPFFLDFQNDREKRVSDSASNLLKKYLKRKCFPTFSPSYLMQQSCYYQRLRSMFYELFNYEPNDRGTASEVVQLLEPTKLISYFPLSVSQATAVEKHDEKLIEENFDFYSNNDLPNNDGTNGCSYLSLGIIDHFISDTYRKFEERKFVNDVQNIIEEFPKKFNPFRDVKSMPDIYDAYNLLSNNNLLKNKFEFVECFVDNYTVYSYELQKRFFKELESLKSTATSNSKSTFAVFHASIYVFAMSAFPSGELLVLETHPINSALYGNGNGIIVNSTSEYDISEWVMQRLQNANVSHSSIPHMVTVKVLKNE